MLENDSCKLCNNSLCNNFQKQAKINGGNEIMNNQTNTININIESDMNFNVTSNPNNGNISLFGFYTIFNIVLTIVIAIGIIL